MADYRFSAQIIKRSKGQSCVASAAYRSASRLVDERTGEIHDYGRKGGVAHSEVMTPEGTPEWMHDRAQLWNAVEAVERRKDAQLAREIQLSLPHELTTEQRRELTRSFVQEQFVDRGMIADVAIHAPSDQGDQRNHHAHIMLTMRELTGEAFGKKSRDWNDPELLNQWREQWALHQNRELERRGHSARVDHRSYEAQGIDREPTKHLGSVASDMERNGQASRIGDENREIANDNAARVRNHIEHAWLADQIAEERWKFGEWTHFKRIELENIQKLADLDLSQKQDRQMTRLNAALEEMNGTARKTIKAELDSIDRRLQAKGVRKILRDVFGSSRSDKQTKQELIATLKNMGQREEEMRQALRVQQQADRDKEAKRQKRSQDRLERGIKTARGRREQTDWKPFKPTTSKAPEKSQRAKPEPEVKPLDAPTLSDKKTKRGHAEEQGSAKSVKRPWQRSMSDDGNRRPWESDFKRSRLERGRAPKPDGGKKP